jgi:hypothetical protein
MSFSSIMPKLFLLTLIFVIIGCKEVNSKAETAEFLEQKLLLTKKIEEGFFNNWKWLTIEEGVQPKTDEKGIPIIKGKNTKGHIIYFYANGTVINTITKEMRNWLPKEPILEEANIKKPTENPIIETEKIVYEEPPSYDEKCKGCGKELYYPKNRKCSWCGNFFDGWSPNEKYDKVAFPILCSDIASEGEAMFFPYYHNGKDWRTYSNCYCSNKCYTEAEN